MTAVKIVIGATIIVTGITMIRSIFAHITKESVEIKKASEEIKRTLSEYEEAQRQYVTAKLNHDDNYHGKYAKKYEKWQAYQAAQEYRKDLLERIETSKFSLKESIYNAMDQIINDLGKVDTLIKEKR